MIQALTEALVQPVDSSEPPPDPEPQLELLLLMEEEEGKEVEKEKEELLVRSPSALRLVFDGDSDQESFYGFNDD